MVTTVYFVRHGESLGNTQGFFQGRTDCELSENGLLQLELLKERFKGINYDAIYSSPLTRTLDTAKAVNFHHQLPITCEEGLIEINGGIFEGRHWDELPKLYPIEFDTFRNNLHSFNPQNGESVRSVYDRMVQTVDSLIEQNKGKTIVLVSHGCAIKNYLCYATSTPFEKLGELAWSDNTSISKVTFSDKKIPQVEFMNDATHLDELKVEKPTYWR
ncbi:MAG: histidine phosphatase family protein [Oscillospiraceae bacterium]